MVMIYYGELMSASDTQTEDAENRVPDRGDYRVNSRAYQTHLEVRDFCNMIERHPTPMIRPHRGQFSASKIDMESRFISLTSLCNGKR